MILIYIKALSDKECSGYAHETNCFYIIQLGVNGIYQSLHDKSVSSVSSFRVKFNIGLSFSKMRKLYLIKFKSKNEFMKGTLKIPRTFQETFSSDSLVQVIMPES